MYFKNIETGEVFQTDGGVYLDSVEITEEEFLAATVKPEITIQPDSIENSGGSISGENLAATKTLELNAADGSAMFAAGAATIGATGLIMSKVDIRCANPEGSIGITSLDQASWVFKLTKSSLAYTNGNVYPATGRPIFDSSTGATLADLKSYQPILSYVPVQQGTGIDQLSNTVKIGWGNQTKYPGRLRATVDTTDLGNIVTDAYLNNGTLPASFTKALSLVGSGSIYVSGSGDTNGYGFVATTPNGIYASKGESHLGALTMHGSGTANLGINYPNVPNCPSSFVISFGYDGTNIRYLVDNNTSVTGVLATAPNTTNGIAAVNFNVTNFGSCYIFGEVDYFSRLVRIVLTSLQSGGGSQTANQNISAIASALGLPNPISVPVSVSSKARFGGFMGWGASLGAWDSNVSVSGSSSTSYTWNMTRACAIQDGARAMGFEFEIVYKF